MNFFKKLQHLSMLNCSLNSIADFEKQLSLALLALSPKNHNLIRGAVSESLHKEIGVPTDNNCSWGCITRSDVNVNQLSFDYFNSYSFRLSALFKKKHININKSRILHTISKVIGLTGSQALKQRKLIEPEFICYEFNQDKQQDIIEIITFNGVIVDVQVTGFDAFCGCNAKVVAGTELTLYTPKTHKYILPDPEVCVVKTFNRAAFKYTVEAEHDVDDDYISGFMAVVDGGVDNVDCSKYEDSKYIQYRYGANASSQNLRKIMEQSHK